jgi:hypothetical protein
LDQQTAQAQARLAAEEHAAGLAAEDDGVVWSVAEQDSDEGVSFVLCRNGEPQWETFASAVESSTSPGTWCAHLRTEGGRNDSGGAVCAVPGIWFPLF